MNKHYIALALLVSTCTASVIKSVEEKKSTEAPQASAQECNKLSARYAEPCACSDAGKVGTCAAGAFKADKITREYYCDCVEQPAKKQQTDSTSSKTQTDDDQTKEDRLFWSPEKRSGGDMRIKIDVELIINLKMIEFMQNRSN